MEIGELEIGGLLELCKDLAIQAGKAIMDVYDSEGGFEIEYKADASPLTKADRVSHCIIVDALKEKYPRFAILSEEEKDNKTRLDNDYCFIIDPLDGTKEFIKRNGEFTVNIALAYKHKSVLGVIYVPVTGELYYAAAGRGGWLKEENGTVKKLQVSDITEHDKVRLVMSSSHPCKEMEELIEKNNFTNFVKMGSSLKGCLIAKGDAEIYYRHNPTMEWDTAAMQCIVEEAGAVFRQMDDSEMLYNRENPLNANGFYIINHIKNKL
ncbi:MAG: 3'(2'),5'-bisphosphate nucleotidase CysQ [Acetatifactor sp.]|nr:3'(2'),5'-bisphosphate nucleotidase CysQ [Acetatifactor sp.]